MSIKIRLAKIGKRNAPAYKIVVAETRSKRNGKFLDILGDFNPATAGKPPTGVKVTIDKVKLDAWVQKGALITDSVKEMLAGTYKYTKYNPKAEKATEEQTSDSNESNGSKPSENDKTEKETA